ncbi:hypothetical protein [Bradyrhizobium sp. Ash2021]|uniref:hypothetical protein n=1 Tax=Bradyrhizobium sp. Ash2021 TaxID=2954771 RepID=UPI002814B118|nr:hypothetical protein [Bradyrhizobium sp. Ash2021]WMT72030.1 hypothetical protein NL528_28690 [Bradyrhizobium sp. Ash2021]
MAKKTITLNARSKWPDVKDDYVIWHQDHAIGRIRLVADPKAPATPWEWFITVPVAMPAWANGTGESCDVCMKEFSAAWSRFLKEIPAERLERAWEFERAAQSRRPRGDPSAALQGAQGGH